MLAGRVRILSDLHLGHPASLIGAAAELRPLLEGVDTVVFNGDSCELAYAGWTERGQDLMDDLQSLCGEVGVRALFLTGNHDPGISELGWLDLWDGALLVTHGDMVHREVATWSREYLSSKQEVAAVWEERDELEDDLRKRWEGVRAVEEILRVKRPPKVHLRGKLQLLSAVWPLERPFAILRAWATMFPAALDFMKRYRPEARVMVFGHFHRPGISWRDGRLLVNLGAFTRGAIPLAVDLEGDWMRVRRVTRNDGGEFRPAAAWRTYRIDSPRRR